jgi:GT2 family glycosyltransferase
VTVSGNVSPGLAGKTVSIIVVTYNSAAEIEDCLASANAARGELNLELIVVDNASSDPSAAIAADARPEILLTNPENVGFARAVNQAIRISSGTFVLLLNPDAVLDTRALTNLLRFLESHPRSAAVGPQVRRADGQIVRSCRTFPSVLTTSAQVTGLANRLPASRVFGAGTLSYWDYASERSVDYATGACLLLRRAALDEVGLLDEAYFMYAEEMDLCWRFWQAGWTVDFTPTAKVVHHEGRSAARVWQEHGYGPLLLRSYYASQIRFWRKHRHPGSLLAWRLLVSSSSLVGAVREGSRVIVCILTGTKTAEHQVRARLGRSLLVARLAWGPAGSSENTAATRSIR